MDANTCIDVVKHSESHCFWLASIVANRAIIKQFFPISKIKVFFCRNKYKSYIKIKLKMLASLYKIIVQRKGNGYLCIMATVMGCASLFVSHMVARRINRIQFGNERDCLMLVRR